MFTRVVQFTEAKDIDGGVQFTRETVAPLLRQQKGYRGMTASADHSSGVFGVLSMWDTEADREASESALAKAREEASKIVGGRQSVEHFEETLIDVIRVPMVGSALLIQRLSMNPAKVEENLRFFDSEVLPQIKAGPGLVAVRQMVNRETGDAIVGTVWADVASMDAAAEAALIRRRQAVQRVTFGEQSKRKIVLLDMP